MAFIYTDRKGTKRCKGCGKPKKSDRKGLCDNCLRLDNAKLKSKQSKK